MKAKEFHDFTGAFVDALVFMESDRGADTELSIDLKARIESDCGGFMEAAQPAINGRAAEAGADFLLTRNWYGEGFDDGGWKEDGPRLTALARSFDVLYVGLDGDNILGLKK